MVRPDFEIQDHEQLLVKLLGAVRRMHAAEDVYGSGFENNAFWRAAYNETAELAGFEHDDA